MNPIYARIVVVASMLAYILIRWPHGMRSGTVEVVKDRKGTLEIGLLLLATIGTTLIPLIWAFSGLFAFADYSLHAAPFSIGMILNLHGLWLFYRSHADLGTCWSVTLQMRQDHRMITSGIYARIRHPMYSAMMLLGIAHALYVPNWLAGPAYLLSFGTLYLLRVRAEEHMMLEEFGSEYGAYMKHTGRLTPWF